MEEILTSKGFREIDDIYLSRGRIFVLLDGRKKLVTFDTKSVDHIQVMFLALRKYVHAIYRDYFQL